MNRRDVITAVALVAASGSALAQTHHHDNAAVRSLFDAADNCVKAGLVCIDHCLQTFAAGDASLAACARAVDQMLSMCGTLAKLASLKSSYLPAMAKVALVGCQDCETSPTAASIPAPSSTIWVTRTSSTPSDTPSFQPTGSATSGEIRIRWRAPPVARIAPELAPARYRRRGHRPRLRAVGEGEPLVPNLSVAPASRQNQKITILQTLRLKNGFSANFWSRGKNSFSESESPPWGGRRGRMIHPGP
jgi:Cys-rich four helix bundle protein (predicted Tat secretion target)